MQVNVPITIESDRLLGALLGANLPYEVSSAEDNTLTVDYAKVGERVDCLSAGTLAAAIGHLISRTEGAPKINSARRRELLEFIFDPEQTDLDDTTADYVIQTASFGKIKFKPEGSRWKEVEAGNLD